MSSSAAGVVESSADDGWCLNAAAANGGDKISPFHVAVNISGKRVVFQLDTAASVGVVGEHTDESVHLSSSRPVTHFVQRGLH